MLKKMFAVLALAMFPAVSLGGCYSSGRVTGEAAEGVQEGARQFERGYEEGRQ